MAREILFELGKMITDRIPQKFGIKKITENDPEYIILDRSVPTDETAEIMLKMGKRKPKTLAEIEHSLERETFYLTNQNLCLLMNPWLHKSEKYQAFLL